ncbi:DUF4350 domain-containing protein [Chitinophaga lutea]
MKTLFTTLALAAGFHASAQKVVLDSYFNNEQKNGASWHYKWGETAMSGFSILGGLFAEKGADTVTLYEAPTAANLRNAAVYIIVDPDTEKESPRPNFMNEKHAAAIRKWVQQGGVLLLMGNDSANAELRKFSLLSSQFGITFSDRSINMVKGKDYPTGGVDVPAGNAVFPSVKKVYMKEVSALDLRSPATPVLQKSGDVVVAMARFGKGTVLAVGDPWLYNEYTDGKRIPAEYENPAAAKDLVNWLLLQVKQ